MYWFGRAKKVLRNSLVSLFLEHLKSLRLARFAIDSGSSVETRCSVVRYCVLGFAGKKVLGNSPVSLFHMTSSSVRLARFPMLSGSSVERNELFSREILRTGFRRGEEGCWKLTGQLILGAVERLELGQIADAVGQLCDGGFIPR